MKRILIALICALCLTPVGAAQKRKKKPPAKKPAATRPVETKSVARSIGSPVVIVTKNGDRISGTLVDLTAYSIQIKSGTLESTIALETIASLSFGDAPTAGSGSQGAAASLHADFAQDATEIAGVLQSFASETKAGIDYTEYGRRLTELRRGADRFIQQYSGAESPVEARVVGLVAGAVTDYSWARTVWTLKLGRGSDHTVSESDSPVVADALALYPELRTAAGTGGKFSADKIVAVLWKKAAERIDRVRSALGGR
ncbi:MAG TPA: hypothetical protein VJH03_15065 [Blastocatellia bacterium]|nr:hypothetical protein [Blastocatellia bacterium]